MRSELIIVIQTTSAHTKLAGRVGSRLSRRMAASAWTLSLVSIFAAFLGSVAGAEPGSENLEFFEKKVRPLLADRCYKCHSSASEKLKGGLMLDSREAVMKGGESGLVVVPGHPEQSKLIEAISYQNPDLQMPPKGRLSEPVNT